MIDVYTQRHTHYLETLCEQYSIPSQPLREALHYVLFPGGKRIRPVLVYLIGELLAVALPVLDAIAASLELTHTYSLIHDDLPAMDNDDLRRGKASCHKAFGEAQAILLGDGLQPFAIQVLLEKLSPWLHAAQINAVVLALVKASGLRGMVSGQSLDLSELQKPSLAVEQLYAIHALKTGKLFEACVEMVGAAQAIPDTQAQSSLKTYINNLGLVFQIQDDYLDHHAPDRLGKACSSDDANHKITFAQLFSTQQLRDKINALYSDTFAALKPFGDKAHALTALTESLQSRTNTN